MTTEYIVIKAVQDTMDAGTLLLTQIALAMASFSSGVSLLLLIDFFKRRGWVYAKHKKKVIIEKDSDGPLPLKEEK